MNKKGVAIIHKKDDPSIYTYEFTEWWWEDELLVLITPQKRIYVSRDVIEEMELEFAI